MTNVLNLYPQLDFNPSFKRALDVYDDYAARQRQMQERSNLQQLFAQQGFPQGTAQFLGQLWQQNPAVAQKFMQDLQLNTQGISQPNVDNQIFDSSMSQNLQQDTQVPMQQQRLADIYQPRQRQASGTSVDQELTIRKQLEPVLKPLRDDAILAQRIDPIVNELIKTAKSIGKKNWPLIAGYIPESALRDPKLKRFAQLANELVVNNIGSIKGQPTNFKTKLLQAAKVSLNFPYETVFEVLKDLKKANKSAFDTERFVQDVTIKNKGIPPLNIADLLSRRRLNMVEEGSMEEGILEGEPTVIEGRLMMQDPRTGEMVEVEELEGV